MQAAQGATMLKAVKQLVPLCPFLLATFACQLDPPTLVAIDDEPPGSNCAEGGTRVASGRDDDRDGMLDPAEVDETSYACDGSPGADGTDVTRALRSASDAALRDIPVVLITGLTGAENTAAGFAAGVTDYLTKPFTPAHVRTRVRAWLMRRAT